MKIDTNHFYQKVHTGAQISTQGPTLKHHLEFLSLKGGWTGSSESTLVQMPHCWKSHATAQLYY